MAQACRIATYSQTHLLTYSLLPYNPPAIREAAKPDGAVRFRDKWSSDARRNLWQIR
jgi:hypothetical protein